MAVYDLNMQESVVCTPGNVREGDLHPGSETAAPETDPRESSSRARGQGNKPFEKHTYLLGIDKDPG